MKKIIFKINSDGGSVVAGLQMYDSISALTNVETECLIYGVCASAATYPALACDKVTIKPNATFMVHLCEGGLYGTIEEIQNDLVFFENLQNQVLAIYAVKTGRTPNEIYEEIHSPKYYTAEQALEKNWVDEIVGGRTDIIDLTNEIHSEKVEVESENKTPLFSLKNILKKCKTLIKGSEENNKQNDDYKKRIEELENKLKIEQNEKMANVEELKNRITELEFEKANLQNTIDAEVTRRLANMGYNADNLPQPMNEITNKDFKKMVKEEGLNAALNALLGK